MYNIVHYTDYDFFKFSYDGCMMDGLLYCMLYV